MDWVWIWKGGVSGCLILFFFPLSSAPISYWWARHQLKLHVFFKHLTSKASDHTLYWNPAQIQMQIPLQWIDHRGRISQAPYKESSLLRLLHTLWVEFENVSLSWLLYSYMYISSSQMASCFGTVWMKSIVITVGRQMGLLFCAVLKATVHSDNSYPILLPYYPPALTYPWERCRTNQLLSL